MNQLIKIKEHDGNKVCSARDLHRFLEITERFANWCKRMFEYGFVENQDYVGCKEFNTLANQYLTDYTLTLDCAKEISMIQRTEKGKQARQYFITCERQLKNTFQIPQTLSEALLLASKQTKKIEEQTKLLKEQESKVLFTKAVEGSRNSCLIGELAKLISQNGVEIGQDRLFEWLRNKGYLGKTGERRNVANQQYIEQGLFELKKGVKSGNDGVMKTTITTKVTGKGQVYFVSKFLNSPSIRNIETRLGVVLMRDLQVN